jgi:DNA-binding MarR family transcriptional regulator
MTFINLPVNSQTANISTNNFSECEQGVLRHLYYKLLNSSVTGMLFKTSDIAEQAKCTNRTVYNVLNKLKEDGHLTSESKGRNGILVVMLKKGWELCKLFKFAFLAFFRNKNAIPYSYIGDNKDPVPRPPPDPNPDRVSKMCLKEGLNESEIRIVRQKVDKVPVIKNLGGLVKCFINQVKDGVFGSKSTKQEVVMTHASMKNPFEAERERDYALRRAKDELKRLGIEYPVFIEGKDPVAHYDEVRAYGEKEAALIAKYSKAESVTELKPPAAPVKQPERWGNKGWSYD